MNMDYTKGQAQDACAIWEHALEHEPFRQWLQGEEGAAQGRQMAVEIAPLLGKAYDNAKWDICFDWDFVPRFVEVLLRLYAPGTTPATLDMPDCNVIADHYMKKETPDAG